MVEHGGFNTTFITIDRGMVKDLSERKLVLDMGITVGAKSYSTLWNWERGWVALAAGV